MPHGKSPKHARKSKKKRAAAARPAKESASKGAASAGRSRSKSTERGDLPLSSGPAGATRLQKLLAAAGFGSRREVEQFIVDERVTVNGRVAGLGDRADPTEDDVRVDGERLRRERPSYWIVNKPRGVVTTVRDDEGRRTVIDLLPRRIERVYPVGRLDRETSGLLLLTNDGDMTHALLHPSLGNEREYKVNVKGRIDERAIGRLEKGVQLEEGRSAPTTVRSLRYDSDAETSSFSLTLVEGRKRQIRRTLLILGFPVRRLVRVRMGPLRLGRLAVGEARPLRPEERRSLLAHVAMLRDGEGSRKRGTARAKPRKSPKKATSTQRAASSRKGTRR